MCGITGLWELSEAIGRAGSAEETARAMADRLAHRGPDDAGTWAETEVGVALGHRRLSIIDLSREGHQPMVSACGRFVVVFNGEVYNYRGLKEELENLGQTFRGASDTEVVVAGISQWGLNEAVRRFNGMFALGVWDRRRRVLSLARDRLGIKPLFYGFIDNGFVFASEVKALTGHPGFRREIEREAVPLFFRYGYVPAPHSIYRGIAALQPATILDLDVKGLEDRQPRLTRFWSVEDVLRRGARGPGTVEEAATEVEALLIDSVRQRMIADVPLGAFLSGGIDSSLVVALMQAVSSRPIRTFTIGFHERDYNEAPYAAAVARHLGTDHTELYLSAEEAMKVVPKIAEIWDEPFADPSQIPTYLVSKLAREHVTVALSGDGGDELFGGYTRYAVIAEHWRASRRLHPVVRQRLGALVRWVATRPPRWMLWPLVPPLKALSKPTNNLSERMLWRAHAWEQRDFVDFYHCHASFALNPRVWDFLGVEPGHGAGRGRSAAACAETEVEKMMLIDLHQYLPDDILTKVDRASMAVSLEARVPLLDHRLVELAWRMPLDLKVREGIGKAVLQHLLERHVPRALFDRPKMGFGIPFGEWIRGPLRGWAEELLAEPGLEESGLFRTSWLRDRWREHVAESYDHRNLFWPILIFEAWRRHWRAG